MSPNDSRNHPLKPTQKPHERFIVIGILALSLLIALYFVARYDRQWTDSDTANLTNAIDGVHRSGTLINDNNPYLLGFAYQALSVFILEITGIDLSQLQFTLYPFIVATSISMIAFVTFRQFTGSSYTSALATLMIMLQPDFLFTIFRGSHEKLTRPMIFLAIFALVKSLQASTTIKTFASYVLIFYLSAFAVMTANVFFGSSFLLMILLSFSIGLLVWQRTYHDPMFDEIKAAILRLMTITSSLGVFWFLNLFYFYQPALHMLQALDSMWGRVAAVTVGNYATANPYAVVGTGWIHSSTYLSLILPTWIIGGVSFFLWLRTTTRMFIKRSPPKEIIDFILWLLYGGIGIQLAAGIILDRLGSIGGNFQHRLLPTIMMLAVPIVGAAIPRFAKQPSLVTRIGRFVAVVLLVWGSVAGLLKSTNEPLLSNYWIFWTKSEDTAVQWIEKHVKHQSIWLGIDGIRLSAHAVAEGFGNTSGNERDTWVVEPDSTVMLVSNIDQLWTTRRSFQMPKTLLENSVYDNGSAVHYRRRPKTAFQK